MKHCRRTRPRFQATRWCVALGVVVALIGVEFAIAQGAGVPANIKGIQCSQGRAASVGVNFNNNKKAIAQAGPILTALDQSGVGWARLSVQWGWIEPKKGVYDWAMTDANVNLLLSVHVQPLINITQPTPCWALQSPQKGCTKPQNALPNKQEWADFVYATVSRYKNRVHFWEIWNEPNLIQVINLPDRNQRLTGYREQILIPGLGAVHAADETAKVGGPALTANEGFTQAQWTDAHQLVLKSPVAEMIDFVTYHDYYPDNIDGRAIAIRNVLRSLGIGTKQIWLTETGLNPPALGVQRFAGAQYAESRQAGWLQADVLNVLASGNVQKVFWFAMTDTHDANQVHTDHYGLVDESGSKLKFRPAFAQLQQAIQSACHQ